MRTGVVKAVLKRLAAASAIGGLATVLAVMIERPWGWRVHVPFSTQFDTQLNAIFVKNVLTGSVYSTSNLGAPFGQHLQDFPVGGDRWSYLLVRAIGLVSSDPYTVLNIFFIIGFGLVAFSMYLVARELRLGVTTSSVVALLAAFLPYHFWRGEMHVWLSNYVAQPLMVLLAVWVLRGELRLPLVHRGLGSWTGDQCRRLTIAAMSVVMLGGTGGYYAIFAVCTLLAAGLLAQVRRRSWPSLFTGVVLGGAVLVVLAANLVPELLWRAHYGVDHAVAQRLLVENDDYALRLAKLLLPSPDHRFGPFAWVGKRTVYGEGGESAGIIAALGLVVGWVLLLAKGWRDPSVRSDNRPAGTSARSSGGIDVAVSDTRGDDIPDDRGRVVAEEFLPDRRGDAGLGDRIGYSLPLALGVLSAFLFLLGTAGGLGYFIAIFGTTQFRGWARVSLPLALCGLLAAGWWVDRWVPNLDRRRLTAVVGAVAVVAVGLIDQVPAGVTPTYASTRASLHSTRAFVAQMRAALPQDAMVFQFPVAGFPENGPIGDLPDYALALPYLVGDNHLRWSYGGVRGRQSDWQIWWDQQPLDERVRGIAAAGFDAITVDRRAYPTEGGASMMAGLTAVAGAPVATSIDGHLAWFDLRSLRRRLVQTTSTADVERAGDLILHSVVAGFDGDVSPNLDPLGSVHRYVGSEMSITFTNPMDEPRTIDVRTSWTGQAGVKLRLEGAGTGFRFQAPATGSTPMAPGSSPAVALRGDPTGVAFALDIPSKGARTVHVVLTGQGRPASGVDFAVLGELRSLVFDEPAVRAVVDGGRTDP